MAKVTLDGHEIDTLVFVPASGASVTKSITATNTYSSSDAGKVVKNNDDTYELGTQTTASYNITSDGTHTYTTTENNSVSLNVNVSGGPVFGSKSITENGIYTAASDNYDGYSSVTVSIGNGVVSNTNFTVTEDTATVTIQELVGTTATHFLFKPVGVINNGKISGSRTMLFLYVDFSNDYLNDFSIASNSTGGGGYYYDWNETLGERFTFNRETGVLTILNPTANYGGKLSASVTYEWFAW